MLSEAGLSRLLSSSFEFKILDGVSVFGVGWFLLATAIAMIITAVTVSITAKVK